MGFGAFRSAGAPLPGSGRRTGAQKGIDWDSPVSPLDQIRDKGLLSGFYGDFNPAARELGMAVRRRESKAQRILARLRQGPATTWELARITGRFSARLEEMKKRGLRYERQDFKVSGNEHSVYTMTQEPRGEE